MINFFVIERLWNQRNKVIVFRVELLNYGNRVIVVFRKRNNFNCHRENCYDFRSAVNNILKKECSVQRLISCLKCILHDLF